MTNDLFYFSLNNFAIEKLYEAIALQSMWDRYLFIL